MLAARELSERRFVEDFGADSDSQRGWRDSCFASVGWPCFFATSLALRKSSILLRKLC